MPDNTPLFEVAEGARAPSPSLHQKAAVGWAGGGGERMSRLGTLGRGAGKGLHVHAAAGAAASRKSAHGHSPQEAQQGPQQAGSQEPQQQQGEGAGRLSSRTARVL